MSRFGGPILFLLLLSGTIRAVEKEPSDEPVPEEWSDANLKKLEDVSVAFSQMIDDKKLPALREAHDQHWAMAVFPAKTTMTAKRFAPLLICAGNNDDRFVINLFAGNDKHQQPLYLFLVSWDGAKLGIVCAVRVRGAAPQRIEG